ncbi:L10-interacting MYB domain-containing protein-like [Macadamia integrifolia]|uniref:L10-interacting MYB domain-containing protein-like n=1 Tax=Macadamia integrifolia TaxID=60698 RepID=UPI001C5316A4|nr:L10-interacting MYB domain-containing protein-like [Macadamia integrifolia]XP_042476544.1 L10-interacting MYB domain-containing protein-like [Macadamia integrifolia]XP_042476545.1 L10-interacting MYB domain-containing protein-like [Macadamia integrifolia]XP_042476546.1 L10-interacting MYB domain-containing protein-like [Macadamia integrifolia]XP_042476547.1 L10-interacting MYB domain-containing protein-like [Macadamia integrifolia]XP_042476548.1 L10-interacting MYB domain-containing protein
MDGEQPSSGDRSRTSWTPPMDRYFIDLLIDQAHRGNRIGNLFSKQAWKDMICLFNAKFGFQYDTDILRNRYKSLRKQYNDIKILLQQNGFWWDETRQMVVADDCIWNDYIKAHPDLRPYKTKIVPFYSDLCMIYGHSTADGRYSLSCYDVDIDMEEKEIDTQPPASDDRSKIDWTPTMDNYFVELMRDQVHKGNKIGNTFKKRSWVHMITSFNTKFGFQYEKDVLKNRYRGLRRQYSTIKVLLGQSGFGWDKTRQMISADDNVWDDYIKAHPTVRVYRNKIIPYYSGLCVICGDATVDTEQTHLDHDEDLDNDIHRNEVSWGLEALTVPVHDENFDNDIHRDEVSWDLQASTVPMHDENHVDNTQQESLLSERDMDSSEQSKRPPEMPSTSLHSKKPRMTSDEGMADVLREMAVAVTSISSKKKENDDSILTEKVIEVLQAIPDIDEDLLLDACDLLEDEVKAKTFLALDAKLRKKWLTRKLRP